MTFVVHVLYPNPEDATFDMPYYLKTHMPLVAEHWTAHGLQKWEVVQFGPGPDGSKPQYSVLAILTWGSGEEVGKAMATPGTKTIMDDVPKFSNKEPIFLAGEPVGSS